jgi:hypothetical protein
MGEISGWSSYKGIGMQQIDSVALPFKKLFLTAKPKRVIEIGTSRGGLTLLLRDLLDEIGMMDTEFISYDNFEQHQLHHHTNINFINKDVFDDMDNLNQKINDTGVTIVLCDGGNKIREFNTFSKFLKNGDIIMGHDYSPSLEYFKDNIKEKIWNWVELTDDSVRFSTLKHNLIPYMPDDFINVVWLCKIKKPLI